GTQLISASSMVASADNPEFPANVTGITGSRYLRLVSDLNNDPGFRGAIAQSVGSMVTGEIYNLMADVFGGPSVGVTYGATISFVNQVSATPSVTYATQTVDG